MTEQQQQHPITPPTGLIQRIADKPGTWLEKIVDAYRAGADQELEACCEWLDQNTGRWDLLAELRTVRRPPSIPETIEVDGHTYRLVK